MEIATEVDVGLLFAMTRSNGPLNSQFIEPQTDTERVVLHAVNLNLRQHRTIASADLSGSFAPFLQFQKREIHTVFPRF